MTATLLDTLRTSFARRSLALLASAALLFAGFAQASHLHKGDADGGTATHLQCLLCLHADRWVGPPQLPRTSAPTLTAIALITVVVAGVAVYRIPRRYEARGPPRT